MNYIREINAFMDWLEINPLDPTTQTLWFHIMAIANKSGWPEWFTIANLTLMAKVGVSENTLIKHRNILIQKNRIEYKSQGKHKAGKYKIIPFTSKNEVKDTVKDNVTSNIAANHEVNREVNREVNHAVNPSALYKLNETKRNNNSGSNNGLAEIAAFYENNIGLIAPFIRDEIVELIQKDAVEPAVIIEALKIAVNNNVRNWSYARAVINAAIQENACTLEKFNAWQREHEAKKAEQKIKLKRQDTNEWVEEITRMAGIKEVQ